MDFSEFINGSLSPVIRIVTWIPMCMYNRLRNALCPMPEIESEESLLVENDSSNLKAAAFVLRNTTHEIIQVESIESMKNGDIFKSEKCPFTIRPKASRIISLPFGGEDIPLAISYEINREYDTLNVVICQKKEVG